MNRIPWKKPTGIKFHEYNITSTHNAPNLRFRNLRGAVRITPPIHPFQSPCSRRKYYAFPAVSFIGARATRASSSRCRKRGKSSGCARRTGLGRCWDGSWAGSGTSSSGPTSRRRSWGSGRTYGFTVSWWGLFLTSGSCGPPVRCT